MKKIVRWVGIVVAAVFVLIQVHQPDRSNPPVDQAKSIAAQAEFTPPVSKLITAACFDCHSNETRWPWYSYIAPVSWLVADDVAEGRRHLNFSEWGNYTKSKRVVKLGQIYEQVSKGDMPIQKYLFIHTDANLSAADRDSITDWTERVRDKLTEEGNN
ncbi:MAG: heme-binding domain-containing protein [Bacteroidota bacterium]